MRLRIALIACGVPACLPVVLDDRYECTQAEVAVVVELYKACVTARRGSCEAESRSMACKRVLVAVRWNGGSHVGEVRCDADPLPAWAREVCGR